MKDVKPNNGICAKICTPIVWDWLPIDSTSTTVVEQNFSHGLYRRPLSNIWNRQKMYFTIYLTEYQVVRRLRC